MFWTAQEIDYSNDRSQFDKCDLVTQKYIKFLLFLFAQLDGIVNENLVENFKRETSSMAKECSMFYAIQEAIEWGHNETYSLLIKTYIRDTEEQTRGLNSIAHYPAIRKIAEWAYRWMDPKKDLLERLVAFACIEGIIFSSAFAGIYWIKRKNILHGLTKANEWIARDEALHTRFAIALYNHITNRWLLRIRLSDDRVNAIITDAVAITEEFTRDAMHVDLVGIDPDDMVSYVKCTADTLVTSLGYPKIYNVDNPFDWMAILGLSNKSNFFETRVTEYGREVKSVDDEDFTFDLNVKF
jgi:ribonucleotide reductase beta subunit family protein with ferritin-like domain